MNGGFRLRSLSAAVFFMSAGPVVAQSITPQEIAAATIVDVPLVLGDIDYGSASSTLWAKGDQPANLLLARFPVRPIQAAVLEQGQPDRILWRAFPDGSKNALRVDTVELDQGPRYFCDADTVGRAFSCLIDKDANGSFDHAAAGLPERGTKPYHVTLIREETLLSRPIAYRILAEEQRPEIMVELRNCAKDYDRPRFVATSTVDRYVPVSQASFAWHEKDSSFANCRRGGRLDRLSGSTIVTPAGGYLAKVGPLVFAVGPKQNPTLLPAGPFDPNALYRLEGNSLVALNIGQTPNQAQIMALKKFPYPMMMADEGTVIHAGELEKGDKLASVPFHHAYRGRLTQDVSISTLLFKRSLPEGTVVYGFPSKSRMTFSRGGIPNTPLVGDEEYRQIDLDLTWCAPVHEDVPEKAKAKDKPNMFGRNGWSAACVPHSTLGNHTIIANLQPAFGISGVSYDAMTSSNDGPPPVDRDDTLAFGQQLRIDYVYEGVQGEFIALREEIWFGDVLTSSSPEKLYAPSGNVSVSFAGAKVELASTAAGGLSATLAGSPVVGVDPQIKWDRNAMMLRHLAKLGLRPAEQPVEVDTGGAP